MHNTPLHSPRGRRIIPARAGFTGPRSSRPAGTQDHPRSRGVYYDVVLIDCPPSGSSPLARGLLESFQHSQTVRRIIPARAGFTASRGPPRRRWPDHPRSRGVYKLLGLTEGKLFGSSPLARGLPMASLRVVYRVRIIPARAGFTPYRMRRCSPCADHPRSRGVYWSRILATLSRRGSSPLARGLRVTAPLESDRRGIIPARAGFTRSAGCCRTRCWDHPRSRGVYAGRRLRPAGTRGSSPLARGLRWQDVRHGRRLRIIPARAGFTLADPWNPNDEPHYQTAFAFTADLALAPQSSDSAVVSQRSTRTPSEA